MRLRWGILTFALAALLGLPAFALDPAGSAVEVLPAATGALDGTTIDLSNGSDVFMGQQIVTGANGQVQIIFKDNTHLVVGPGSTLLIAEYLLRNEGTASKFVIDALGGTFRFATGNSNKNAYEIRTPTGTIGVRGTRFDFDVDRSNNGETHIVLYEGAVEMCATGEQCVRMSETCGLGLIPDLTAAEVFKRTDQRSYKARANFHYLNDQSPLRKDFRFTNTAKCKAPAQVAEADLDCPENYTGNYPACVPPPCPDGYSGTFPHCEPPPCPDGYAGTYPSCEPPPCPDGYSGTFPNCQPPPCPSGYSGTFPNCQPPPCPSGYTGTYPSCQPPPCPSGWTGTYPSCQPPVVHECPSGYSGTWPDCTPPDEDDDDDDDHHGGWGHWPGHGHGDDEDGHHGGGHGHGRH